MYTINEVISVDCLLRVDIVVKIYILFGYILQKMSNLSTDLAIKYFKCSNELN